MQQMLILFQIANNFPVHALVLQRTMQDDEDLGRDGPVVKVGDVALEDEL